MIMRFDPTWANGHTRQTHALTQMNVRVEFDGLLFVLYEHDQSPFQVELTLQDVQELTRFFGYLSRALGEQRIKSTFETLVRDQGLLAHSLADPGAEASTLLHTLEKLSAIFKYFCQKNESTAPRLCAADVDYLRLLSALPNPPAPFTRRTERTKKGEPLAHSTELQSLQRVYFG